MPAYLIVTVDYTDMAWTEDYRRDVPPMINRLGGRYLALARPPNRLEGEGNVPETLAIIEFPTLKIAQDFFDSDEYRPYAEARKKGARTTIYLVEAVADT